MAAIEILGLDHVVLRVADSDRARRWYESVLGCRVERIVPSIGLIQLRAGATLIDLVQIGDAGGIAAEGRNMDHVCVQLAAFDAAALAAHLARHGIAAGQVARRYGALGHGPSIYITDPDGNMVELKGPPDGDQTETVPGVIRPG